MARAGTPGGRDGVTLQSRPPGERAPPPPRQRARDASWGRAAGGGGGRTREALPILEGAARGGGRHPRAGLAPAATPTTRTPGDSAPGDRLAPPDAYLAGLRATLDRCAGGGCTQTRAVPREPRGFWGFARLRKGCLLFGDVGIVVC